MKSNDIAYITSMVLSDPFLEQCQAYLVANDTLRPHYRGTMLVIFYILLDIGHVRSRAFVG